MTKKDYVKFAQMVKELPNKIEKEVLKKALIKLFHEDSGSFNEIAFRSACEGIRPTKVALAIGRQIPRR